jgi:hypothetical protein
VSLRELTHAFLFPLALASLDASGALSQESHASRRSMRPQTNDGLLTKGKRSRLYVYELTFRDEKKAVCARESFSCPLGLLLGGPFIDDALKPLAHDLVALAGGFFQALQIQDRDVAARVGDEAGLL